LTIDFLRILRVPPHLLLLLFDLLLLSDLLLLFDFLLLFDLLLLSDFLLLPSQLHPSSREDKDKDEDEEQEQVEEQEQEVEPIPQIAIARRTCYTSATRSEPMNISGVLPKPLQVRFAESAEDIRAAQRLRYEVFNLELNEGLEASHATGLDQDAFDEVCQHLLLEEGIEGKVVGTYRLQTGESAARALGYYSEQEFDFEPYETLRPKVIELGRACIARGHRNPIALALLWRGIAAFAKQNGSRYLIGCSSLTSQDPREGAAAYSQLVRRHLASPDLRTNPRAPFRCAMGAVSPDPYPLPKLLRTYLALGAMIAGPPAIDRDFGTIDFLTIADLGNLPIQVRRHFLQLE